MKKSVFKIKNINTLSDKAFNGTVNGGSLENMLTVPLRMHSILTKQRIHVEKTLYVDEEKLHRIEYVVNA